MNILTKLESDHQEIRLLVKQLDECISASSSKIDQRFQSLKSLVIIHHDTEQNTLFDELVQHDESRDKAMHLVEEHGQHKKLIDQLNQLDTSHDDWIERYQELRHDLLHHIEEEEQELFSLARNTLDDDKLSELGRSMVLQSAESITS